MTPEQHARAKEVFLAACEQPAGERSAFVDGACAEDAELRAHINALLRHHNSDKRLTGAGVGHAEADLVSPSDDADRELESGTIVADRYRIVSLLGKGGMGEVYRADDLVLEQPIALKFLSACHGQIPGWLERFVREARVARQITNPHICRIHDVHVERTSGETFISMEYIDGEDLRSLMRRIGRLQQRKAFEVACEMCVGLAAAHAKGILHRDLKPANIMIDGKGSVRITDFGLAATREQITADEIMAGTPAYMAPELFAGTDVSVRSDIYALGLVLYELFTGRAAFRAPSFSAFARAHQRALPTPPCEIVQDLPPAIDLVIRQCLEKDPADRPPSALAVAAALPNSYRR